MRKQTIEEEKNTAFIKEAIEEFYENSDEKQFCMTLGQIMIRMAEDGKAPMAFKNTTRILLGAAPDDMVEDFFSGLPEPKKEFVTFHDDAGDAWIPLFTDRVELNELIETNEAEEIPIKDIIKIAYLSPDITGIIINPYTDRFMLFKDELEFMLENLGKFEEFLMSCNES